MEADYVKVKMTRQNQTIPSFSIKESVFGDHGFKEVK